MNRKIKRSLLLTVVVMLFTVCLAFGASAETITGECGKQGDNVTWSFDTETETLTIQGEGEMADYAAVYGNGGSTIDKTPWGKQSCNVSIVIICDGVTSVGAGAFCSESYEGKESVLTEIILPKSLKNIGVYAFDGCKKLAKVMIDPSASVETIGDSAFDGCSSLVKIEFPQEVKSIGKDAFSRCSSLQTIEIPEGTVSIGDYAFSCCSSLKKVEIPASIESIGLNAFNESFSIESIDVNEDNLYYSSDDYGVLFDKDKTILIQYPVGNARTEYKMPDTVKTINEYAFGGGVNLDNVVFSNNLEEIGGLAFCYCLRLQDVSLPKSLKRIGEYAFTYCISLNNIVLPENLEYIGSLALFDCQSLKNVSIKSMSMQIDETALCGNDIILRDDINLNDFVDFFCDYLANVFGDKAEQFEEELNQYIVFLDHIEYIGTIYCHLGSTAEAYAIENGIDYVTQHFYGEWISDFDNMLQYRVCETCGHRDERPLTQEEIGDVEIITPDDPDHDFEVDEKEPGSDSFVLVQEILGAGIENCNVLKVFDITYKNKDGVHVQPDGSVRVKLPLDWEKDGIYKVYRVNDDGTYTDMNAIRQGSHMVFETDHFSLYVIVDESEQAPDDTPERDFFQKIFDWFRQLLDLLIALFK
ncbi:MAG: leucine-rich repeat domain-containing protein [Acutalibacteraceae bacterium]